MSDFLLSSTQRSIAIQMCGARPNQWQRETVGLGLPGDRASWAITIVVTPERVT